MRRVGHPVAGPRPAWRSSASPLQPWGPPPPSNGSIGMPGGRCPSRTAAGRSHWTASPGKPGGCWATVSVSRTRRRIRRSTRRPFISPRSWIPPPGTRSRRLQSRPGNHVPMVGGPHGHIPAEAGTTSAADKWDSMPLLVVDSLELRKLLGMAPDQKYIAAAGLAASQNRIAEIAEADDLHGLGATTRLQAGRRALAAGKERRGALRSPAGLPGPSRRPPLGDPAHVRRRGQTMDLARFAAAHEDGRRDRSQRCGAGVVRDVPSSPGGLLGQFTRRVQRGLAQVPGHGPRNGDTARGLSAQCA